MRAAVLVVWFLAGCQIVFPLHDRDAPIVDAPTVAPVCDDPRLVMCVDFEDDLSDNVATDIGTNSLALENVEPTRRGIRNAITMSETSTAISQSVNTLDLDNPITVDLWMRWTPDTTVDHEEQLFDNRFQYDLFLSVSDNPPAPGPRRLKVRCGAGTTEIGNDKDPALSPGLWQHVACVIGTDTMTTYLDGVVVATADATPVIKTGTSPVQVGGFADPAMKRAFHGDLDDVRVWNTELTLDEVQAFHEAFLAEPQN